MVLFHWQRTLVPVFINSDVGKDAFRHFDAIRRFLIAQDPNLNQDRQRSVARLDDIRIAADHITNPDRAMKGHGLYANGRRASTCPGMGGNATGHIHLRKQPAAKYITTGVGIGGHRQSSDRKRPAGPIFFILSRILAHGVLLVCCISDSAHVLIRSWPAYPRNSLYEFLGQDTSIYNILSFSFFQALYHGDLGKGYGANHINIGQYERDYG